MSAHTDTAERARYVRAAYNAHGKPPTAKQAPADSSRGSFFFQPAPGDRWSDILREAGVPGYDELVAEELRRRWDSRHDWQDHITVRAKDLARTVPLHGGVIGDLLAEFESGERSRAALDGLAVSVVATNTRWTRYEVREA